MDHVDFCLTTFKRPKAVERLILSIGERYPNARIYLGDQNESLDRRFYENLASRSGLISAPELHHLDFDCGLSTARNHLVINTPSTYKLILEDDFVFSELTDISAMVNLLDAFPEAGVVGGGVAQDGRTLYPRFMLHREHGILTQVPDRRPYLDYRGTRYSVVDFVSNFALVRRDLFGHVWWDPNLKVFEHADFYLRVKESPYKTLFTPDAIIGHSTDVDNPDYRYFRQRTVYIERMLRKHDLYRMEVGWFPRNGRQLNRGEIGRVPRERLDRARFGGEVTELRPDGSLVRHVEFD
jgi:GT2 family glycosyltransferase